MEGKDPTDAQLFDYELRVPLPTSGSNIMWVTLVGELIVPEPLEEEDPPAEPSTDNVEGAASERDNSTMEDDRAKSEGEKFPRIVWKQEKK